MKSGSFLYGYSSDILLGKVSYYFESSNNWQLREINKNYQTLEKELGLTKITSILLSNRGIKTAKEALDFLNPTSKILTEPALIPDLKKAVARIRAAIKNEEPIFIYGDYDVDGITSTTLLYEALLRFKADVSYHIPCRFKDGYGLKKKTIDKIAKAGAKLLITVDCGIKNFSEVDYAKKLGLDVIITDHHEPAATWPKALAVVNPKLPHCEAGNSYLAGVGVALKLAQLLCDDALSEYFDLVALGTIADIAPMVAENRYLAKNGIDLLNRNPRLGISKLAEVSGLKAGSISTDSIGFGLGPRLNAGGRLSNASVCVELLTTKDEGKAAGIAQTLQEANAKRAKIEDKMLKEVLSRIENEVDLGKEKVIFLADEHWHDGIKGIIASRVKERFFRPAFIGTFKGSKIQASGRSIPNFSLKEAMENCGHLLTDFGGHQKAGGLTVEKKDVQALKEDLNRLADEQLKDKDLVPTLNIEAKTGLGFFDNRFEKEIEKLEPFGEGNQKPLLLLEDVYIQDQQRLGQTGNHLKLNIFKDGNRLSAVSFNLEGFATVLSHQGKADLVIKPDINVFRGRRELRVNLVDLKLRALSLDDPDSVVDHLFANRSALAAKEEYKNIGEAESFHSKLAGVTFDGRQGLINKLKANTPLKLSREPGNPHDPNAIRVLSLKEDDLGFLNKRLAKQLAPLMDAGQLYDCRITDVTGGSDDKNRGVNVVIERYQPVNELEEETIDSKEKFAFKEQVLEKARQVLLGANQFHSKQKEALDFLLNGQNTLAVMGTGRGKSAVFQAIGAYKALWENKISLFIYPLRSLIADQYLYLKEEFAKLGLKVVRISGDCSVNERQSVFQAIRDGQADIALTTPEFLHHNIKSFKGVNNKIGFLVVDEAHHISTAGHNHRPLYKEIDKLIPALGSPLVMATTATANDRAFESIVQKLSIKQTVIDPSIRENLCLSDKRDISNKESYLKDLIENSGKVLIYVNSREKAAELANNLRFLVKDFKDKIVYYHAGLNNKLRLAVQEGFMSSAFKAVVATSAFGEGINIGDITDLVLYHLPFSFIQYNQQSGRCGRDGSKATIHALFGGEDARINELILESKAPGRKTLMDIWRAMASLAKDFQLAADPGNILAELNLANPGALYNNRTIASSLKIFAELGLIEKGEGRIRQMDEIILRKEKKVNLSDSVIFEEGLHEKEQFVEFKEWALNTGEQELLEMVNQPIRPQRVGLPTSNLAV